ncbi:MAG: hypothetical protein IT320_18545 [Anaerolineae bacterium]|nr:hypothetical protein [Anaerolineae bacterium]
MRSFGVIAAPIGIPLILIGSFQLIRAALVISGRLKGPLLHIFEAYTDKPQEYNALRDLALWATILIIGVLVYLSDLMTLPIGSFLPLVIALVVVALAQEQAPFIRRHLPFLMPQPHWYADLSSRTTLMERRRIAYMWLRLPRRTRILFNHHDGAFRIWVDLVIMGTLG